MKLKSLWNRNQWRQDLDDELRSHIEMMAEELEARGMSPADAMREARRRFGNVTLIQEDTREFHVFTLLDSILQDLRYGLRRLRHEPAFTLAAVLTLGLVIGANGTIFTVLEAMLLRPLPFADPSAIVVFGSADIPVLDLEEMRKAKSFAAIAAEQVQSVNLTGVDEPGRLIGSFVDANYFPLLGVNPARGRGFREEEGKAGGARVCLLSDPVWRSRFGGDENILNRTLLLNGESYAIVGILPASYRPMFTNAEVWMPVHFYPNYSRERGKGGVGAVGRLASGVSLDQARLEVNAIWQRIASEHPKENAGRTMTIQSAQEMVQGNARGTLYLLAGAVLCVLLLGCANIAGLLLTKAAGRKQELAIRASIGASRGRLMRQLLTECLLLSAFGGALGVALAYVGTELLVAYCGDLVRAADLQMNTTVLLFLGAVSVATGILFGLAPALATQSSTNHALRQRGIGSAQGALRGALVAGQVGLALVLLIFAGLMVKSVSNVAAIDTGFRGERVLTMEYRVPRNKYPKAEQQTQFHNEVLARVSALPGVEAAGIVGSLPFSGNRNSASIALPDRAAPTPQSPLVVQFNTATPRYFETVGIPVLSGRDFQPGDGPDTQRVAIVSQSFAKRFWPGEEAIGKQIGFPDSPLRLTVVGLVGDTKHYAIEDTDAVQMYRPYAQATSVFATLAVRTQADPNAITKSVQRAIWSIDKDQPMWKIRTLQSLVDRSYSIRRYLGYLLVGFSATALILAAIGLYGVIAYLVAQRNAEFGIRLALGAKPSDILGLVVRKGLTQTIAGLVGGIAASLLLSRLLTSQVYGVSTTDPVVYVGLSLLLLLVGLVAVFIPARRAMRVDPAVAMRQN